MRPNMKLCCPSLGTSKGGHLGGHSTKILSHLSSGYHGGSNVARLSHHGAAHMSTHHGGSRFSHHGGSHSSHLAGGSQFSHHGGSNLSNRGSSHLTHYGGGPHLSLHGGSHLSHHKSYLSSSDHRCPTKMHHGSSHMSHHGGSFKMNHRGSNISHYGGYGGSHNNHQSGHCKFVGAHSGSSSKSASFSKNSSSHYRGHNHASHLSHGSWKHDGMLSINEKETMQKLNQRLSSYLNQVTALEQENAQLERKICEWYANNAPSSLPDSSQYFRIISELQNQIAAAAIENARIVLQIDNARIAADDYRDKYEMEQKMANNTEADINALCKVLEGLKRETCALEMDVQNLQDELQEMKRNHEEEVNCLLAQLGARINVEMNAAPSIDLNCALAEIRNEYENLMERNLRDAENMFRQRTEELNRQVMCGSEELQCVQTEVIELHRIVQALEIELQSELSMISALECTLAETQATYACQLDQLQGMINNVECQLAQIRCDLERQNHEYKILMDQKNHLEMEIANYKCLLDGNNIHISEYDMSIRKHGSHHKGIHHSSGYYH